MNEAGDNNNGPSRRPGLPWKVILLGWILGLAASLAVSRRYVAEASLLFPTINASALKQVTKTLKMDGSGVEWDKSRSVNDEQVAEAASLVLQSRAALTSSLQDAKVTLPPTLVAVQGDPLEFFRKHNVTVDGSDRGALHISVSYSRPEGARALCQGLLNYYTTFVHEHRLTNTARTRQQLEEKLVRVDKRLSVLERKLLINSDRRYRVLTDISGKADPKVIRELWKQRILEGGSTGRVLDEMRKIRKEAGQDNSDSAEVQATAEDWRARWGSTTLEDSAGREGSLPRDSRRSDLPSRLELERVYEETLLLYHSGLLQYDFLSMWESLENFDFELIDPVTVHQDGSLTRLLSWSGIGALAGLILGALLRRSS